MDYSESVPPGYSQITAASNPLVVAELRLAPTFAHIVAFSITYELVAVLCSSSFVGALFLLGPSFASVAVFAETERVLGKIGDIGDIANTTVNLLLWGSKLTGKVSVLLTANLVARLVTTALHQMEPVYAVTWILYLLALGYSGGRVSGVIT